MRMVTHHRARQDNGDFHTAKATVFPVSMNFTLALAVHRFLLDRNMYKCDPMSEQFEELNMTSFVETDIIQPDYHG